MQGKTVLITGGNSGIGKETAVALAGMGATVAITSRDAAKGEAAVIEIRERSGVDVDCLALDLASFASIRRYAADVLARYDRLDVLINNAGLISSLRTETKEGFETTFGVNHLGHFLLTQLLLERLKQSAPARIINVSSVAHRGVRGLDFDDLQSTKGYRFMQAYGRSKLANIYFTRELARRLEGTGVTANALHPGNIATGFGQDGDFRGLIAFGYSIYRLFIKSAKTGAKTTIYLATAPELEHVTGRYFSNEKEAQPAAVAQDDNAARKLWDISEQLVAAATSAS